ncbi:FAD-binding oxidoreductase [Jannaschia sp. Os4]|uniref:NAD(P)/FAD-dependent oxidoreductase n=1 Tax=Jannaschia sp. Os4 TaxID=2807617 RepID=UPI001939636B|nr:FAD-dependent oxidoreductase [Jannaschia sp. Os4]MBM2575088.1 FAD-binding oxidoreductase [Jannaschia sp. Os4]
MIHADFIVIGGGIAGTSAGAALASLGRVLLWEAEADLRHHASGRSAALFEESYGLPPTVALNRASRAAHAAAEHLSARGLLLVGMAGEEDALARDVGEMRLAPLCAAEARDRVPILSDAVIGAGWHDDAWDLDTDAMVTGAARAIRDAGGAVETGRRVDRIARTAAGWRVHAGDRVAAAPVLVDAAGPWADAVAGMAGVAPMGLTPLRRSMARIAAPAGHDVRGWPMVLGAGESWYMKPDAGALIVSPAEEEPAEAHDAWADDMVIAEALHRWEGAVTVPATRPLATWAGLRTFAPDRALVLGPDPDEPSFVWCAGQGGYGFQTAPAAARLLADRVAGRAPELDPATVAALSPERLR